MEVDPKPVTHHTDREGPRGYPTDILRLDDIAKFLCTLCEFVLRKPVQYKCGHRFCKACVQHIQSREGRMVCPSCHRTEDDMEEESLPVTQELFADRAMQRELNKLSVKCNFPLCEWLGSFQEYETLHYMTCPARPYQCPYCLAEMQYLVYEDHIKTCPEVLLVCDLCQTPDIKRGQMQEHQNGDCEPDVKNPAILKRMWLRLTALEEATSPKKSRLSAVAKEADTNRQEDQTLDNRVKTTEDIQTVLIDEVETVTRDLSEVKNKLSAVNLVFQEKLKLMEAAEEWFNERADVVHNSSYVWRIDDVTNKMAQARDEAKRDLFSPAFYLGQAGYKMCIRLFLNGDGAGKGTHISPFVVLMKGDYDAILSWPFTNRITITLMNQRGADHMAEQIIPSVQNQSFHRPTAARNVGIGIPMFVQHTLLDSDVEGFVVNDVMFLKIQVHSMY